MITAAYSGSTDTLWTQTISATVEKIKKAKKPKKIKIKKPKVVTKKENQVAPVVVPVTQPIPEDDIPYTTMALL
jgi:hypothetical protein